LETTGLYMLFCPPVCLTLILLALAEWFTRGVAAGVVALGLLAYYVRPSTQIEPAPLAVIAAAEAEGDVKGTVAKVLLELMDTRAASDAVLVAGAMCEAEVPKSEW
jgi:hypothetical protein